MGKTTIALEVIYDTRVIDRYREQRIFISCEALIGAESVLGKLAEIFGVPKAASELQAAVVTKLTNSPRKVLVLDNLETVWLSGGAPVDEVDVLLGTLAQVPSLSLMITCRGIVLPQFVDWSNVSSATLEPFSLEAALETFQDRAGRQLSETDEEVAKELLRAVDMMPLAVTLLGQLAQRGTTVHQLLARWNREHSALRLTSGKLTRNNSVTESIVLSIKMVSEADKSQECIELLSVCAMLPDGMFPDVFEKMRPHFENIDLAEQTLRDFALVSVGRAGELKLLSPVRHLVLERHPAQPTHRDALHVIYCDIAVGLPMDMDETYKEQALAAAPEMGNLSSLLLTLVTQPSQCIVNAVVGFIWFTAWQRPSTTFALALLPHLEQHPQWKADCLKALGYVQYLLDEFRPAINLLTTAAQLYLEVGDLTQAADCKCMAGEAYVILGEYDNAEEIVRESRGMYDQLESDLGEAYCRRVLGELMRKKGDYAAAIEHLKVAQQLYHLMGATLQYALSSQSLGSAYLSQDDLAAAAMELEAYHSASLILDNQGHLANSTLHLSILRRRQGDLTQAELLLCEAERLITEYHDRHGLAQVAMEFGFLRRDQGREVEAIACFESAKHKFAALSMRVEVDRCMEQASLLRSAVQE